MSKRTSAFISLIFVSVLFISFSLLVKKVILVQKAAGENLPPQLVKISNIHSLGFTVSWFAEKESLGTVLYSTSEAGLGKPGGNFKTAYDTRGPVTFAKPHYVLLENLTPNTTYYFVIKSGSTLFYKSLAGSWLTAGIAEKQKTAPETNVAGAYSLQESFKPNLVFGQILSSSGEIAKGAIAFLEIPGKSSLLSELADNEGKWAINLANLIDKNLLTYLVYNPSGDLIRITAQGVNKEVASSYRLISRPDDETDSLVLKLNSTIASQNIPGNNFIPTIAPSLSLKLKFQAINQKGPDKNISLVFNKSGQQITLSKTAALRANEEGVYSGEISSLAAGTYDLTLKAPGHLAKSIKQFVLKTGLNSLNLTGSPFTAGDLNSDNVVNMEDLGILIDNFRTIIINDNSADFNADGQVNSLDLGILINNYRLQGD